MSESRVDGVWTRAEKALVYAVLTVVVWGLTAFSRGLWQDDAAVLGSYSPSWRALFDLGGDHHRRLGLLPYTLALNTPHPVWTLQLLYGAVWIAQGLLVGWVVSLLLPDWRRTRYLAVCLTLTATSDFLTDSIVALAYNQASMAVVAALGCSLVCLSTERPGARIAAGLGAAVLLALSLWTIEVAPPALPFLAVLLFLRRGNGLRRFAFLMALLAAVAVPFAFEEWRFLHDPHSYAAVAVRHLPLDQLAARTLDLYRENFFPWRWVFNRQSAWSLRPPAAIATAWMVALSGAATLLFLAISRQSSDRENGPPARALVGLLALFAAMALAVNATYAQIQFSSLHYRTHVLSRLWASAAIAIACGWLARRSRGGKAMALVVAGTFVFFGCWGGLDRQDYYLASWHAHQRELVSILTAAPALRPGTLLVLRSPPTPETYLATEADYIAGAWMRLLYEDPTQSSVHAASDRGSGCAPVDGGLRCWTEGEQECVASQTCKGVFSRFEDLVVMDYDVDKGTYRLVDSLAGDPFGAGGDSSAQRYRPSERILARPMTVGQRRLLLLDS